MNERLANILKAIDRSNQDDPILEHTPEGPSPKEWLYGIRMSEMLATFAPDASDVVQIASRAQHICRWEIPRDSYPMTRPGYLTWRKELGRYHGEKASEIMAENGYADEDIARVQTLLQKRGIKTDAEVQLLEDIICLVFLQYYLDAFAVQHEEPKVISILQKTWRKMSGEGQQAALALDLSDETKAWVGKALA